MRPIVALALLAVAAGASSSPEDDLIAALDATVRGDFDVAEQRLQPLLTMRPRFHLAHLIKADILAARAGLSPAMARAEPPGSDVVALRAEARRRLAGYASGLDALPPHVMRVPESLDTILIADVASSRLTWFSRRGDSFVANDDFYLSIGRLGAGKQRAWDRRTPLGAYFFVSRLEDDELAERYGSLAFPMDYPNAWDRVRRRTGDGIWLHGIDRAGYSRPPLDSDGCLVIANRHLETLAPAITAENTPVLVLRDAKAVNGADPETRAGLVRELEATIEQWRRAWAAGDGDGWLRHYADDFRPGVLDYDAWRSVRAAALAARTVTDVAVDDLLLLRYPEEDGLFMARFTLTIGGIHGDRETLKRLYFRRDRTGRLRIVAAANG